MSATYLPAVKRHGMESNHHEIRITAYLLTLLTVLFVVGMEPLQAWVATDSMHMGNSSSAKATDIVRDPSDLPPSIGQRAPAVVHVTLTAEEVIGVLDASSGTTYRYWTFNGKVPGPMIRVRQGDTVEITLQNSPSSHMVHSVDFHAALGPGGGAAFTQAAPGKSKTFSFQATTPGLFVYHCGTPMIAEHIANGMYGMILVEPASGLPRVDHEYYLMQGEFYTSAPKGKAGLQQFSAARLMQETPDYFVFNGAVDALSKQHPLRAKTGDTVRIFFGDAGPNETSSLHAVGEIFTREYELGSLMSPPLSGIQTATVPPGGAAILELKASMPGQFALMDHAMARMAKGLMATLDVTGIPNPILMSEGPAASSSPLRLSGVTPADAVEAGNPVPASVNTSAEAMPGMSMQNTERAAKRTHRAESPANSADPTTGELNGCMTELEDGRVMLRLVGGAKTVRLEAQPFLFSQNANRLVHVTGRWGSVVEVEDPNIRSFVVKTLDPLAPDCSHKLSAASIRRILARKEASSRAVVGMTEMSFVPSTLTVNVGEKVVWKNSSEVTHNVIDDSGKALNRMDVNLPSGGVPFASSLLLPEQSYSRVFTVPGVYRYVCTLHEAYGMKGVIIVRPSTTQLASDVQPKNSGGSK